MSDLTPHQHGGTDAPECTPYGTRCQPAPRDETELRDERVVKAEALREFDTDAMAEALGGKSAWLTSASHVANIVRYWLDEEADRIEADERYCEMAAKRLGQDTLRCGMSNDGQGGLRAAIEALAQEWRQAGEIDIENQRDHWLSADRLEEILARHDRCPMTCLNRLAPQCVIHAAPRRADDA